MQKQTLFLIPDISGFTRFITQTEVSHGQHIISELLELLIDSNTIGLTLAEIEGDALLFYKEEPIPSQSQLLELVQSMFINFHRHLKQYEHHRICHCGACQGAGELSLKIIAHSGVSDFISVKGQEKPFGQDLIISHRLLKNRVESNEYFLATDSYLQSKQAASTLSEFPWAKFDKGFDEYQSIGKVTYEYCSLSPLKEHIPEITVQDPLKTSRPILLEIPISRPRDEVFELIIDLNQRMRWNNFANRLEFDPKELNQVGTRHVCVFDAQTIAFESVTTDFGNEDLVYGEKLLDLPPFARDMVVYFIVGPYKDGCLVKFQLHYELKPLIGWVFDPFLRYKIKKTNRQVLQHLKSYSESGQTS